MNDAARPVTGTWALTIATPIGRLPVTVELAEHDGVLSGTAQDRHATVLLQDLVVEPGPDPTTTRLTWRQSITKPLRLDLDFDVAVAGDTMTGHSKAGRLPRSTVSGERRSTG